MPGTTPRGYPYAIPADPADMPAATQALAEAIDLDVQARAESVHPRAAFRLSSTSGVAFPSWIAFVQNRVLPFENQDALVGAAITPLAGSVDRVTPLLPGFWRFYGAMVVPRAGATLMDEIGITLQTGTQVLARNNTHLPPPVSDGTTLMHVKAGGFFNGTTDYVQLVGTAHVTTPTVGVPQLTIRSRYLFGARMTES